MNRSYEQEVGRATGLPIVALPYLPAGVSGPKDLENLGASLLQAPRETVT